MEIIAPCLGFNRRLRSAYVTFRWQPSFNVAFAVFWNECFVPLTLPYVYDTSSFHFTERVASSRLSRGPRGADQLQMERSRCTVWTVGDDERLVKDELDGGAGAVGIAPWHVVG